MRDDPPDVALELALHPDDAPLVWRAPAMAAWRQGRRVGSSPVLIRWRDTPDGALAASGLVIAERRSGARTVWRLEARDRAGAALGAPVSAVARTAVELARAAPEVGALGAQDLVSCGHIAGTCRWLRPDPRLGLTSLAVTLGTLDAQDGPRLVCRMTLAGRAAEAFSLAHALAGALRLSVPATALPAEACTAHGTAARPRHLGAPVLPPDASVDEALATLLAQLGDVLPHWSRLAGADAGPEPVHQLRVAVRRLRSALKVFGGVAACPALDAALEGLRELGQSLGAARDWDVFLGGIGRTVAAEFAAERTVARMLAAAERQRRARYAELACVLDGPGFRRLLLTLAELAATRPWRPGPADEAGAGGLAEFGRQTLHRRLRRVARAGSRFDARSAEELHALRLHCKRLRYACELFAPAFPGRAAQRFARRLATVQERLGVLNDGAVASALMRQLGPGRGLASGLVRGFVAARDGDARARAERSWRRFRHCAPFWT